MSVIIILIVISVVVAIFFLGLFIWAVKTGQFDDTYSPSVRILFDDKKPANRTGKQSKSMDSNKDKGEKKIIA
jgi:cbb3-type cytochrome oxidase maturation protein